jgi:hypothetical protein
MSLELWLSALTIGGSFAAYLFWTVLDARFVDKKTYDKRVEESDLTREQHQLTMAKLEGKVEFLEREWATNFDRIGSTLIEIKNSLSPFIADHQNLKDRVTRIEASSDARNKH